MPVIPGIQWRGGSEFQRQFKGILDYRRLSQEERGEGIKEKKKRRKLKSKLLIEAILWARK